MFFLFSNRFGCFDHRQCVALSAIDSCDERLLFLDALMNRARMSATVLSAAPTIACVHISHPDRLIYPDQGISKVELARYYESIADGSFRTSARRSKPRGAVRIIIRVRKVRALEQWVLPRDS